MIIRKSRSKGWPEVALSERRYRGAILVDPIVKAQWPQRRQAESAVKKVEDCTIPSGATAVPGTP